MKKLIYLLTITLFVSCASPVLSSEPAQTASLQSPVSTEAVTNTPEPELLGMLEIREGDQIERDILPRLMAIFHLDEAEIKSAMSGVRPSDIISPALTDFRRMEGQFVPGQYPVSADMTLEAFLEAQLALNLQRVNRLSTEVTRNRRTLSEAVILASVVEAECLDNRYYQETADVFNNRLDQGTPMQSCVTAEYALGLQRFFLYGKDVEVDSPYNTYQVDALPIGPIASFDDASLKAAMSTPLDREIQYFYYDYLTDEMHFFSDYRQFKKEANASMDRFIAQDTRDPRAPINKQEIYR